MTAATTPGSAPRLAHGATKSASTVLIADDIGVNRRVLQALLVSDDRLVLVAENGAQAVQLFELHAPDVVLLDVQMPVMDGYEACRRIKQLAGERFVPVLFLTALTDEESLVRCVEAGGDDVMNKPFDGALLRSKLHALERIRRLHDTVRAQSRDLRLHRNQMLREQDVARQILERIVSARELQAPNLRYLLSPAEVFSGDLLLATRLPSGVQRVLLGDFTGHGLPAAVGTLPVAEMFFELSRKGIALPALIGKLSDRVRSFLPDGVFLAACGFDFHPVRSRIVLWNGGLPDALLVRPGAGILKRFPSQHLPLGILPTCELELEEAYVEPGDRLYAYSDGVIEHQSPAGVLFGQERLEREIATGGDGKSGFAALESALIAHGGAEPPHDDITLVELCCTQSTLLEVEPQSPLASPDFAAGWNAHFEFLAPTLRRVNPPLTVLQYLMEFEELHPQRESLYLVLAELFTNALDHGLLGLHSEWKQTANGFEPYLSERVARLAQLETGSIQINLQCEGSRAGRSLRLRVEDSGPGFDWRALPRTLPSEMPLSGRGLPLVRALCESVEWVDPGNRVEVVYRW
jgi:CheY-like chemotaxis protein/anti-sigma regulatory factor (Ser/Thr protein kinase)